MNSPDPRKEDRAYVIATNGFLNKRNPIDTAGMDTSDEEWLYENKEYEDFIIEQYKYLQNQKKE